MKKIFIIFIIGIFIVNGLGIEIVVGNYTKEETQILSPSTQTINNDKYEINSKYSYIRSYPGGGGIFIIKMTPKNDFCGYVSLQINADSNLNAVLDKHILNKKSQIAELTIQPNEQIELKTYEIKLTATYHKNSKHIKFINLINKIRFPFLPNLISFLFRRFNNGQGYVYSSDINQELVLEVEMFDWTSENLANATIKRDELINWIETEHPEFGIFSGKNFYAYITYPAHLIVEHWTFLYNKWEMRICYHVTIPPYNWLMICLRPRGEFDFVFAAKREYNGTTYEIPISDYPVFYGY